MRRSGLLPSLACSWILAGCAAALVPETSDPATKLNQARSLWREGRVIPAERLMLDSIDLAREQKKYLALGDAQVTYARFLRSSAFGDKFFDAKRAKMGGPEGVKETARQYLREAERNYVEAEPGVLSSGDPFHVSNLWLLRSVVYQELDDRQRACGALENSLAAHRTGQQAQPGVAVRLPPGYKSFDELIHKQRAAIGCS